MPKTKTKPAPKSTTISIHGDGFDIDAEFATAPSGKGKGSGAVGQSIADLITMLAARLGPVPPAGVTTAGTVPGGTEHDFDAVKRVIDHGQPTILRAIIDLASAKLEQSGAATPPV